MITFANIILDLSSKMETATATAGKELLKRVEEFNTYHEGLVRHQMTVDEHDNGTVQVKGPLRIYWGLSRPIQLAPCDDIPPAPISKWRHSLCVQNPPTIPENRLGSSLDWKSGASPSKTRDLDDLFLNSPSSPDDVTMRKKKVRKFKTIAYRGKDEPTRWKRASINGHIFNYDTSVFTPVLGSCTSVTVNNDMNTADVVDVLLDKFKVQNSPEEYDLILVSDSGERLLTSTDKPLMERLRVGPDEALGKLFIKERDSPVASPEAPSTEPITSMFPEAQLRNTLPRGLPREAFVDTVEEEEEENLPMEVETLLILPEAVLRGVLAKYSKDEEQEVSLVKARYATAKNRIRQRMSAMTPLDSSSKA